MSGTVDGKPIRSLSSGIACRRWLCAASTVGSFDLGAVGEKGDVADTPFANPVKDFYQTNPIARASRTMAECSALHASAGRTPMAAE